MVITVDSPLARRAAQGAALLRTGQYNEGFKLFDGWRDDPANLDKAPALPFPRWSGQPVAGKRFLVWSEHGVGDQIMYARFARILQQRGAQVSWLCAMPLTRLFASLGLTILPADVSHDLACDFYCPSSALPLLFDFSAEPIPAEPYLFATPRDVGAKVGFMPDASKLDRSMPAPLAAQLQQTLGAIDLRPAATGAQDFQDTAEIIAGLDLVVTVDTSVAHLAGALGRPVWIFLGDGSDWRWLEGRSDSPWYPTATLFRGPWDAMVDQVRAKYALFRSDGSVG